MTTAQAVSPSVLYEQDETAWLEAMSELIRLGRLEEIDYPNLAEYLADMARRDRREVIAQEPGRRSVGAVFRQEIENVERHQH